METAAFDRAIRLLSEHRTRRVALGSLIGGIVGTPMFAGSSATAKQKPCPPCKKRKKGKCKATLPDGAACATGICQAGQCVASPSVPPPASPPPPPPPPPGCGQGGTCLVFLSSSRHAVNFGGPAAADAICQNLAVAAGLAGSYKAWVSDSTSAASSRFSPSPGPYKLVNGTTIANSWTDLRDGSLLAPINMTESGGDNGGNFGVWTGTRTDGSVATNHCNNWTAAAGFTGAIGSASATDETWTELADVSCTPPNNLIHFYCFQQR